ncbi:MAG: hypothetical protein K0Q43_62 [Ramlibacter sp.]|jgi:hypothetical protein|nr:hypothetical protein [Ramlibacter sp.]
MDAIIHLDAARMRLLCSISLYRGSSSELDLLPMQQAAMRPFTAARALSNLANEYPDVLERSRAAGMREALQGEILARRGGEVELPPAFRDEVGTPAAAGEVERVA